MQNRKVVQSTKPFVPIKLTTKGAILLYLEKEIDENGNEDWKRSYKWKDEERTIPLLDDMGNHIYTEFTTLVFSDGCRFNISRAGLGFLMIETLDEGTPNARPNDRYLPMGLIPGQRYSAERDEDKRAIIKWLAEE